ncbi:hypothetical protein C8A03DRAFT_38561, partial [Achaetomium macrosporum]
MLKDVPALPAHLPRHGHIAGRPLWHVPDPEHEGDTAVHGLDLQYPHGRRVDGGGFLHGLPSVPDTCYPRPSPPSWPHSCFHSIDSMASDRYFLSSSRTL